MSRTYRRNKKWMIVRKCGRLTNNKTEYIQYVRDTQPGKAFVFEDERYTYGGNSPEECYSRKVNWFISDAPRILYYGEGIRSIVVNQMATRYNRQQCRKALHQIRDIETAEIVDFKQAPKQVAWKLFAWY